MKRLEFALVEKLRDGFWKAGAPLPSENALAKEYGVSRSAAHKVLNQIEAKHLVYQVRGVGTFAGSPGIPAANKGTFLFLSCDHTTSHLMRLGFEERISSTGASSMMLPYSKALELFKEGQLTDIAGVFDGISSAKDKNALLLKASLPAKTCLVRIWNDDFASESDTDYVSFDNVDGGRQAAMHLLEHGHTRIAFMGLHLEKKNPAIYTWSKDRCRGWTNALEAAGITPSSGCVFFPPANLLAKERHKNIGYLMAENIISPETPFSAIVCANDKVAAGLIRKLKDSEWPNGRWPAIVGFDDSDLSASMGLSSLHLSWKELGAAGAELLLDRASGRLKGAGVKRFVKMKLIRRLAAANVSYDTVKCTSTGGRHE
ncbi:MAG: GntR family transcriptional regulator [Victivallales bacterium]